jgi:hypothetical protein
MFMQPSENPPLWMLGVRIECAADARQLAWLVERCGVARIRAAAVRRTLGLAPRPGAIAAELELRIPDPQDLPELALRSRHRRELVHPA